MTVYVDLPDHGDPVEVDVSEAVRLLTAAYRPFSEAAYFRADTQGETEAVFRGIEAARGTTPMESTGQTGPIRFNLFEQ